MALYLEVIERDTEREVRTTRSHYQIAKIYKRRYDWDKATLSIIEEIVALDPTGYYANEAKTGYSEYSQKP